MQPMAPADSFALFAALNTVLSQTPKRLHKAALVANYCQTLDDAALCHAARFLAGDVFAGWDKRTLSLGAAAILAALELISGQPRDTLRPLLVQLGDVGALAASVWPAAMVAADPPLMLAEVAAQLSALAELRGTASKRDALVALLQRTDAEQACALIRLTQGELRSGLKEGALEDALARMAGLPLATVQRANMLLGDIGETALGCRHGSLGLAHMRLFHPLKCMLATAADDATAVLRQMPQQFVAEDKYDGIRAQAHVGLATASPDRAFGTVHAGMRVTLFSRTQDEITAAFPDLVAPLAALATAAGITGLILDAEIVPVDGTAVRPFAALQTRLGRKAPTAALQAEVPVALIAFDLLYADGIVYLDEPHSARRAVLAGLPWSDAVRLTPSPTLNSAEALEAHFLAARQRGNEGLVLKDPAAPYRAGRRGREWLKMKRPLATLDVVVTAAQVGHGRRSKWLSDYTFAVRTSETDPTLLNVGKAYSGVTDAEIAALTAHFRAHTLAAFAHGKVVQVTPNVVMEVTFDKVQASTRHKSGYALRFPRIVRLRPDKPVDEIDTLATVKALATP